MSDHGVLPVSTGLDQLLNSPPDFLRNARLGLVLNQASIDRNCVMASERIMQQFPGQLKKLFSPQHGLWCEEQANMIESPHQIHPWLGLPVHSLYSETRRPSEAMLDGIDVLLIDLQDVGTRVYTFVWTMLHCLEACAENGIRAVVLDRPNPLGGDVFEGSILQTEYRSFVGLLDVPMRHGLTIGEMARLAVLDRSLDLQLDVLPCSGWQRSQMFDETGLPWFMPSPNMPRFDTAVVYPGQVLLEGTNLSEGRGTTLPFQIVGAPWVHPKTLADELNVRRPPGVEIVPIYFRPTFDKWSGQRCGGIAIHVTNPHEVRSFSLTVSIFRIVKMHWPDSFAWLPPPYEYETIKPPIDILAGDARLRNCVDSLGQPQHSSDLANDNPSLARCDDFVETEMNWSELVDRVRMY